MSAAKFGRLEARLVVPSGGWLCTINDGGGPIVVTLVAGSYYATALVAAWQAAIAAAIAGAWPVTVDNGESGTGKVTIGPHGSTFTVTWTSTDLRDALGFSGNLSGAATYTSTSGMRGMWLPDCPAAGVYRVGDDGHTEGGPAQTFSPLGVGKTIVHPTRVKVGPIQWSHIGAARSRQGEEASGVRSFERFQLDTLFGQVSYFMPGDRIKLFWDAGLTTPTIEFYPRAPSSTAAERSVQDWGGLYRLSVDGWKA